MSEYQYYEFRAVDRPLTSAEMSTLRTYSSRATISPTRFANEYSYGNFKGDPAKWMDQFFDAFLYIANWNTRELMLRLPRSMINLRTAREYLGKAARATRDHVILAFFSEEEGGEWVEEDEGAGWMSSILPARSDLAAGDLRLLYLGWLRRAQLGELEDGELEPSVPAGLDALNAPQRAFAEFLGVDGDLVVAAAEGAPGPVPPLSDGALRGWIESLPERERTDLLVQFVRGRAHVGSQLIRRFREATSPPLTPSRRRTVGELLAAAAGIAEQRAVRQAKQEARRKAQQEKAEAEARSRRLESIAARGEQAWDDVEASISRRAPVGYDAAVKLLTDLRDVAQRSGGTDGSFQTRIAELRHKHRQKGRFLERLEQAGL